ncbi:non-homologous end-joining DNA ligase [Pricia sp. S334]|uniref:DNA ligase (ATP) n=1 Tax=Pricia mediterranea TaxID=3076079 RepID=A0ABU3L303_9FLAO|nr:non-homologous end-joining DNA ligase [Pricia sp. S334]MDT7827574.1 non-homologous end-joining DNA ligase [Pricia sp. S334]
MDATTIQDLAGDGSIEKTDFPEFRSPMLATLTKNFFDDPDWIYERKLDGMRCLVYMVNGSPHLYSRNGKKANARFPELTEAMNSLSTRDFVIDGEIVAFEGKVTSFKKLQKRMQVADSEKARSIGVKTYLYIFDLLYFDGYALHDLPLVQRKQLLKRNFDWNEKVPLRYTPHRREKGQKFHKEACNKGWEGIIAKDGTSTYRHTRSRKWLKFKCVNGQELVIGGFTEPQGDRKGFGALLVGFYEGEKLQYAGKVGTGFSDEFLKEWRTNFDEIEQSDSPFSNYEDDNGGQNHWVAPDYVGQFEFTEWTDSNKLRHPSFVGIRDDKDPKAVKKEM